MKCPHCQKELKLVTALTNEEEKEFVFVTNKQAVANTALNPDIIKCIDFSEEKVYEYFKAIYDTKCEAEFLNFLFFKKISEKYSLPSSNDITIVDGKVYIHEGDK